MPRANFRLLSWNIDMDTPPIATRARALLRFIRAERPDIVCLQEVTEPTYEIIHRALCTPPKAQDEDQCDTTQAEVCYDMHVPQEWPNELPYYSLMLTKQGALKQTSMTAERFAGSRMQRGFVRVDGTLTTAGGGGVAVTTAHLESLQQGSVQRKEQMAQILEELRGAVDNGDVAVFAGDTNLREAEVSARLVQKTAPKKDGETGTVKRRKVEPKFQDAWILGGSQPDEKYTWDMSQNDNHEDFREFKPKTRYDRCFVLAPKDVQLRVERFKLLGKNRLPCDKFVSDHWGVCIDFTIDRPEQE